MTTITNAASAKLTLMNIETETIGEPSYEKHSPGQVELRSIFTRQAAAHHYRTRIPNYPPTNTHFQISIGPEAEQALRLDPRELIKNFVKLQIAPNKRQPAPCVHDCDNTNHVAFNVENSDIG